MEHARATWTDQRLDDFSRNVERSLVRIDEDLRSMRGELTSRLDAQGAELGARIDSRTDELSRRIDLLQRTMIQFGGAATLGILATLVSVILTRA